jgi:hypothetical protein
MLRTLPQITTRWSRGRRPGSRAQRAAQQGQGRSSQSAREQHQLNNIARQIETLEAQPPQPLSCWRMPRSLPQMRMRWSRGRRPRSSAQKNLRRSGLDKYTPHYTPLYPTTTHYTLSPFQKTCMHTVSSIPQIFKNAEHSIEGWRNSNLVHRMQDTHVVD